MHDIYMMEAAGIGFGEFIVAATKLQGDLSSASSALAAAHRNVLSQPPDVLEPASPIVPAKPVPAARASPEILRRTLLYMSGLSIAWEFGSLLFAGDSGFCWLFC